MGSARHIAIALITALAVCPALMAQPAQTPTPDFAGIWTRTWKTPGSFDPPPSGQGPIMVDPAHPRTPRTAENGVINYAIAGDPWVPDLNNPILKPATRDALSKIATDE